MGTDNCGRGVTGQGRGEEWGEDRTTVTEQ